ncbi:hypothetical protein FKM82_012471 [Ascaphus truei]
MRHTRTQQGAAGQSRRSPVTTEGRRAIKSAAAGVTKALALGVQVITAGIRRGSLSRRGPGDPAPGAAPPNPTLLSAPQHPQPPHPHSNPPPRQTRPLRNLPNRTISLTSPHVRRPAPCYRLPDGGEARCGPPPPAANLPLLPQPLTSRSSPSRQPPAPPPAANLPLLPPRSQRGTEGPPAPACHSRSPAAPPLAPNEERRGSAPRPSCPSLPLLLTPTPAPNEEWREAHCGPPASACHSFPPPTRWPHPPGQGKSPTVSHPVKTHNPHPTHKYTPIHTNFPVS